MKNMICNVVDFIRDGKIIILGMIKKFFFLILCLLKKIFFFYKEKIYIGCVFLLIFIEIV